MKVTLEEVARIARLAHLHFSQEELVRLSEDLDKIFEYVEKLDQLDTDSIPIMSHVHDTTGRLRGDETRCRLTREEALKNAPDTDGTYFRVPKVIE